MILRRSETALFALVFVAYAYFYQAGGWNQNARFDLTRAWVEHGSASIDPYHHNTGDKSKKDGHYFCDKAPGASALAVPAWALVHAVAGGPTPPSAAVLRAGAWSATVFSVALPSAALVVALALALGALGVGRRARCAIAAAYGLATLAWPYSTLLYGHQLTAALAFGGLAILIVARHRGDGRRASRAALLAAGGLLGASVAVEYPSALLGLCALGYLAVWLRPWRRLGWFALGAAPSALATALYHAIVFGGPATLPYEFSTQPHRSMGFFMGLGRPDPAALWHILLSPYRGLFYSAPWLLLALPGAIRLARAEGGRFRAEAIAATAAFALFVWLDASLVDWQGGWAMGPRYLVPALPFVALLIGGMVVGPMASAGRRRVLAWAAGALVAYSFALMLIGTAVKPEVPVTIKRPFGAYLVPAFAAGRVAISTQSIDSATAPRGGPRQASNLGIELGLDGLASLVPLALLLAAGAGWLGWTLRSAERPAERPIDN